MKKYKTALVAITFIMSTTVSFAQSSLEAGIKLSPPYSTLNKNRGSSSSSDASNDNPFLNSYMSGMGNMIRGMSNGSCNEQELQKQQSDYLKQQVEQSED